MARINAPSISLRSKRRISSTVNVFVTCSMALHLSLSLWNNPRQQFRSALVQALGQAGVVGELGDDGTFEY